MTDLRDGRAPRLVIVGGGITGLAAGWSAVQRAQARGRHVEVTILERAARWGGNLVTEHIDGFLLDGGPDSWVASKPHATALVEELGLGLEMVGTNPETRRFCIAWGNRLHRVPEGLVLGVPTRWLPLLGTRIFSWAGKLRMVAEPFVPARRFEGDDDESIAAFAARRLGREAAERLVAPLLGGISAGDAADLSVRAAFPQLVAMERDHGSLVRGMRAAGRRRRASPGDGAGHGGSAFLSLAGGVGRLVDRLTERLAAYPDPALVRVTLRNRVAAERLVRTADGWIVEAASGERFEADGVVVAIPPSAAARLLLGVDERAATTLATMSASSTATVFLACRRERIDHPLDSVGFVVPRSLGRPLLAATWVSSKWRGRAPKGHALVRAFFGGSWSADALVHGDDALTRLARDELGRLGVRIEPAWSRVFRFPSASAQMRVGHLAVLRGVRERLFESAPGVRVAGGGYDGVGIPDCVRQGREAADMVLEGVFALDARRGARSRGANGQNSPGSR